MNDRLSVRWRTLVILLALATLATGGPGVARAAEEIKIAGEYSCRGGNPGGGAYLGKVIIAKTGQTYRVQWMLRSGEAHAGVGIREGDVLAVCYVGKGVAGIVAYKIEKGKDGPRLVGRWAGLGDQKTQAETLTQDAPMPEEVPRVQGSITRLFPTPSGEGNLDTRIAEIASASKFRDGHRMNAAGDALNFTDSVLWSLP